MTREVMQQALEALDTELSTTATLLTYAKVERAMMALRAELAKPEPFTPDRAGYRQGVIDGKAEAFEKASTICSILAGGWKLSPKTNGCGGYTALTIAADEFRNRALPATPPATDPAHDQ
jgi:hypothetical protein